MNEEALDLQPLSDDEIRRELGSLSGWTFRENKIIKTYELESFNDALALINAIAPFCNRLDHHPDIQLNYKKVTFALARYSIGGKVTKRDFTIAGIIEDFLQSLCFIAQAKLLPPNRIRCLRG